MFDFDVLESSISECNYSETIASADSTSLTTTPSVLSTPGSSLATPSADADDKIYASEERPIRAHPNRFCFFDFDELEEVEAALTRSVASSLVLEPPDKDAEFDACGTPGAIAASSVAKSLASAIACSSSACSSTAEPKEAAFSISSPSPCPIASKRKTLFLFDWDDTLCPTSWIENRPELKRSALKPTGSSRIGEDWENLAEHARAVAELVRTAHSLGTVALVTLAQRPWVSVSSREFMPGVSDELNKLDVFYARETASTNNAQRSCLGCPWTAMKKRSMQQALSSFLSRSGVSEWDSFISIGDSDIERRAAQDLGREYKGRLKWTKTVKLLARPSVLQLTMQVRTLNKQLVELTELSGHRHVDCADWLATG